MPLHTIQDGPAFAESDMCNICNVKSSGRYKCKDVDTVDIVMLTYS
jgi:hypothetical protein